ncbi:HAMP domain-containing sensor histidine kinase [Telmatospirillum sp.]|uniref:sensor histidine kinase n=1 Tax=Telmatospirillum sp. TaxID=2079197 RepID=UPI00284087CE|nr:HAMP domain-containing sensor histidine kinase [Telmatospirillum sp.]MDR3435615.1 HAMP domain-containing sensor histidine kinase [Telmatospirillum sp.]
MRIRNLFIACVSAMAVVTGAISATFVVADWQAYGHAVIARQTSQALGAVLRVAGTVIFSRGIQNRYLLADDAVGEAGRDRIAAARRTIADNLNGAKTAVAAADFPERDGVSAALLEVERDLAVLYRDVDKAVAVPRGERDTVFVKQYGGRLLAILDKLDEQVDHLERVTSIVSTDPAVGHFIAIARLAWHVRDAGGRRIAIFATAVGAGQALTGPEIETAAGLAGETRHAWQRLRSRAFLIGAQDSLGPVMADVEERYFRDGNRLIVELTSIGRMGGDYGMSYQEVWDRLVDLGIQTVLVLRDAAIDEAIAHAEKSRTAAFMRFLFAVGVMALVLGTVFGGALFFSRWIVAPLIKMTAVVTLMARGERQVEVPAQGRADEIGAMAHAIQIFKLALIEGDDLARQVAQRTADVLSAKERAEAALKELSHTQASLVRAEKMASLAGLVGGIAHEINTPIGVALTAASYFERNTVDVSARFEANSLKKAELATYLASTREAATFIATNLTRAAELVQSFKKVAVDQTSEVRRSFDLAGYLAEIIQSLRPVLKKVPHVVGVDCPGGITIDSYPGAIFQIITNFVMNSLHHAFEEGQPGHIQIAVREEAETVVIDYSDDGRGIAAEYLDKIFDPFFTTSRNRGGSGLGLHIVYNLVTTVLKGDIRCESEPGRGTRMNMTIPKVVDSMSEEGTR